MAGWPLQRCGYQVEDHVSFYASLCILQITLTCKSPADCDLRSVICFLSVDGVNSEKMYRPICDVNNEKL